MRRAEEIPQEERKFLIPGREDVFEADGKFFVFLGRWAGWQTADRIRISENGSVSAISGELLEERITAVAGRILSRGELSFS